MDVVTLGETMVMLWPTEPGPLEDAVYFRRSCGGAESNVAIGLARLGHTVGWMSRVGDDPWGRYILRTLRGEGVDVSRVIRDPDHPTGLMVKEWRRPGVTRVHYYRKGSAASHLVPEDVDEAYLARARILHVTGITPALSASAREAVVAAVAMARRHGVLVSFDPNLRLRLWDRRTAAQVLGPLAAQADAVLAGEDELDVVAGTQDALGAWEVLSRQGVRTLVVKRGPRGALAVDEAGVHEMAAPPVPQVVDPVGAGDAFAAGYVSGWLEGLPVEGRLARAVRCGARAVQVQGDWEGAPTRAELAEEAPATDVGR